MAHAFLPKSYTSAVFVFSIKRLQYIYNQDKINIKNSSFLDLFYTEF